MLNFIAGDITRLFRTLCLVIPLGLFLPTALMPHLSVNLKDVYVFTSDGDEKIHVVATRDIEPSWVSYTTSVRDAITNLSVCDTPVQQRARYYDASTTPSIDVSMEWWMGSREDFERCVDLGLQAERKYIIRTCHFWHGPLNFVLARRCVDSNVFELIPENFES